jgi:hypothetical protein
MAGCVEGRVWVQGQATATLACGAGPAGAAPEPSAAASDTMLRMSGSYCRQRGGTIGCASQRLSPQKPAAATHELGGAGPRAATGTSPCRRSQTPAPAAATGSRGRAPRCPSPGPAATGPTHLARAGCSPGAGWRWQLPGRLQSRQAQRTGLAPEHPPPLDHHPCRARQR